MPVQERKSVRLLYNDLAQGGTSDKEYRLSLLAVDGGFVVAAAHGRRDGTLNHGYLTAAGGWSKVPVALTEAAAQAAFDRKRREKLAGDYQPDPDQPDPDPLPAAGRPAPSGSLPSSSGVEHAGEPPCELLTEIGEREALRLIESPDYYMQRKENGQRRLIRKSAGTLVGINRRGLIVPLPPPLHREAAALPLEAFLIDGEIIGSRFIAFDLLEAQLPGAPASDLRSSPYQQRFWNLLQALSVGERRYVTAVPTWFEPLEKTRALKDLLSERAEGAVFKLKSAPFRPGRNGSHAKFKFLKTLTAKILRAGDNGHHSITLALRDAAGRWVEVGHASAIGKGSLPVGGHVEVIYLCAFGPKVTPRLVQARVWRMRPDQTDADCGIEQAQFYEGQGY